MKRERDFAMDLPEKIAYLKGLMEGLGIDPDKKEGKILHVVVNILDDLALTALDMQEGMGLISDQLEGIDDDLEDVMMRFYDHCDDFDDDDFLAEEFEGDLYEVTCPQCGDVICVDEEMLDEGEITCPGCGEPLEFDFSGVLDDCDDFNDDEEPDTDDTNNTPN